MTHNRFVCVVRRNGCPRNSALLDALIANEQQTQWTAEVRVYVGTKNGEEKQEYHS